MEAWLRGKFTNQQLYDWLAGQLSALHFQAYQLAVHLSLQSQIAANFELGVLGTDKALNVIGLTHSDATRRRLTAGDELAHELRRLDAQYMEANYRKQEITKHISLAQLDPECLIVLRETGRCQFSVPEWIFDRDFPQHLNRLIKSVSLSLPCVTGSYGGVSATLRLVGSSVRLATGEKAGLMPSARAAVAMSTGQDDSGMFELNFHDERYLPFEGAGAVSTWELELGGKWWEDAAGAAESRWIDVASFDFDTISDVVLHMHYTAQVASVPGFSAGRSTALAATLGRTAPFSRLFSLRHDIPMAFQQLINATGTTPHVAAFELSDAHFPYVVQGKDLELVDDEIRLYIKWKSATAAQTTAIAMSVNGVAVGSWLPLPGLDTDAAVKLAVRSASVSSPGRSPLGSWTISAESPFDEDQIKDVFVLMRYRFA